MSRERGVKRLCDPFIKKGAARRLISAGFSNYRIARMLNTTVGVVAGIRHRAHLAAALDAPEKEARQ